MSEFVVFLVLVFVVGFLVGAAVAVKVTTIKDAGNLHFYESEPGEQPVMVAELLMSPEYILKQKHVSFKVSQK
jgi:hypothetical protein